ncbi:family transcription regulator protein [Novosphingobium sp. Rr 2-17]|nr:family transcription regulator protein [Novosphingobium sp. Rr 2-17]
MARGCKTVVVVYRVTDLFRRDVSVDLNQIRLTLYIADHGSLTQAAIALGVEQSVISRQLSALEKEYGERLFHRTGRGMVPTEFGAAVFPRLQWLLDQADRIENEIKEEAGIVSGDVRIGFLPALSSPLICRLVPLVEERYERIKLHFFEGSNGQLQEWLANGTIDVAMLYRYGDSSQTAERVLGTNDAHLIGLADSPLLQSGTVTLSQLDGIPLVLPNTPNSLRNVLAEEARKQGITLNVLAEADSILIQKSLVRAGQAFAILGAIAIDADEAGVLRSAKIVDPVIHRSAVLATTTRRPLTGAMKAMVKEVEELALLLFGN